MRIPGACRSWPCSTWRTTLVCSVQREELLRDGWNYRRECLCPRQPAYATTLRSQDGPPLRSSPRHLRGPDARPRPMSARFHALPQSSMTRPSLRLCPGIGSRSLMYYNKLRAKRWERNWLLGWRRIARSSDERTMISTIVPRSAVGDSEFLMLPSAPTSMCALLAASLSSFVLDYAARQKMAGTNLSYFIVQQLPIPSPDFYSQPGAGWMLSTRPRTYLHCS